MGFNPEVLVKPSTGKSLATQKRLGTRPSLLWNQTLNLAMVVVMMMVVMMGTSTCRNNCTSQNNGCNGSKK
jgi:hypothetical protein